MFPIDMYKHHDELNYYKPIVIPHLILPNIPWVSPHGILISTFFVLPKYIFWVINIQISRCQLFALLVLKVFTGIVHRYRENTLTDLHPECIWTGHNIVVHTKDRITSFWTAMTKIGNYFFMSGKWISVRIKSRPYQYLDHYIMRIWGKFYFPRVSTFSVTGGENSVTQIITAWIFPIHLIDSFVHNTNYML